MMILPLEQGKKGDDHLWVYRDSGLGVETKRQIPLIQSTCIWFTRATAEDDRELEHRFTPHQNYKTPQRHLPKFVWRTIHISF